MITLILKAHDHGNSDDHHGDAEDCDDYNDDDNDDYNDRIMMAAMIKPIEEIPV